MEKIENINKYILDQVKCGNIKKDVAMSILKELLKGNKSNGSGNDVAIIGLSCKFSEAENKDEYWKDLTEGLCTIRKLPKERREDIEPFVYADTENKEDPYCQVGYINDINKFDSDFFRISPREANLMDPKQRLFLEVLYEAIEDGGYGGDKIYGSETGIFVGNDHSSDGKFAYSSIIKDGDMLAMTGCSTGILASRAAYIFDLKGPSVVVDTACSSGLVSVHMACEALKNEECKMAVAGGINILLYPRKMEMMTEIESESVRVKSFDKNAKGTSWGEGVAALLLKPLNAAIKDKDNIYAVIKGSAINNDGASNGITAPSAESQEKLIIKAWERAGVNPETISYIETHGTGTVLGDPIEIKGITNAFKKYTNKKQFCGIGSVKPNIGHTVAAAGLASVIKVVLAMKNGVIPPSLNFDEPNPFINFCNSSVFVNDKLTKWNNNEFPKRAGVSSFGFSGTNTHIVLEEPPQVNLDEVSENSFEILTISAKDKNVLMQLIDKYANFIDTEKDSKLEDICYTANTGRKHFEHRISVVAKDKADLRCKIEELRFKKLDLEAKEKYSSSEERQYKKLSLEKMDMLNNSDGIEESTLKELCEYYDKGVNIDWEKLYEGRKRRRVSIPTYPFKKERHWVDFPKRLKKSKEYEVSHKEILQKEEPKIIQLVGRENNCYSEVEYTVAQVWGNVLGFSKLDIASDFYEIGGDSITALKIVHTINKQLNVKVETTQLLKAATIEKFSSLVESNLSTKKKILNIDKVEKADYYEVASSQKRVFILNELNPEDTTYNIPLFLTVEGSIDEEKLEKAFNALINRHETLRTSFKLVAGKVMQKIEIGIQSKLQKYCLQGDNLDEVIKNFVKPFDLSKAPLIRTGLVEISENKHLLMIDVHHIVADGYSVPILEREFMDFYEDKQKDELKIQFKDFANWQNNLFKTEKMKREENYWMDSLKGKLPVLNLPYDYPKTAMQSYEGDRVFFNIGNKLTEKINKLNKETKTTLFMFLTAALNVLLYRYTGQEDIIVGTPIAGRTHEDLHELIGMFVNTLALRNNISSDKSFRDFLGEVSERALCAYENQDYPFDKLIEKLKLDRNLNSNALFNVMFALQVMDNPIIETNNLKYIPYNFENKTSKFDIVLNAFPSNMDIRFELAYCSKLFKKSTIENLAKHYINILESVVLDIDTKVGNIEMIKLEERKEVLAESNNVMPPIMRFKEKTIGKAFERQVRLSPKEIAVDGIDGKLTYDELNVKANKLARSLLGKGIGTNSIVGIMAERTTNFVVGIMAVLKAGAAYLPIDTNYPNKRVSYMLMDSKAEVLLIDNNNIDKVDNGIKLLNLEDKNCYAEDGSNIEEISSENSLAYVIYTSGSTGKPKGVMIEHKNVLNLVQALDAEIYCNYKKDLNIALLAPFVFDASIKQIFPSLLLGHNLCVIPSETRMDGIKLVNYYRDKSIHISDGTPAYISILSEIDASGDIGVKQFVIGGEALKLKNIKSFYKNFKTEKPLITNVYGPTECCVDTTSYTIKPETINNIDRIPIGKPIRNCKVYILDKDKNILPKGVIGEIYIAGAGVGRGYINNSNLTEERFVEDIQNSKSRMYRTGDLGKWMEDGNIQFIGRADHQVKIRGFRIELDEIRNEVLSYKAVKDAVVIMKSNTLRGNYLCAYVVSEQENVTSSLREYLVQYLPDYMIPSNIVQIETIPLTNNGKVDISMLPEAKQVDNCEGEYKAPRNYIEEVLCKVWGEILGLKKIGVSDNFFEKGGDSIKAIQAAARMEKYSFSLEVKDIFQYQTIEEVSPRVKGNNKVIDNSTVIGKAPLAPMQYWLLNHCTETIDHRNLSFILYRKEGFGEDNIRKIFKAIVSHHDALRMTFSFENGDEKQYNNDINEEMFELKIIDLTSSHNFMKEAEDKINEIQGSFSLSNGPIIKLGLIKAKDGEHLFIAIHQMIIDHISWRIIFEDFSTAYTQLMEGKEILFQNKTDSFIKWAQYIRELADDDEVLKEKKYWREIENSKVDCIPTDFASENNTIKDNAVKYKEFDEKATELILKSIKANKNYKIDAAFLTALALTLKENFNCDNTAINLGNHGRSINKKDLNISRTIGRFSSIYPIILNIKNDQNVIENLQAVNKCLKDTPCGGVNYGILKYIADNSNKLDIQFKLKPEISFNYMGDFDNNLNTDVFKISELPNGKNLSEDEKWNYKFKFICLVKMGKLNIGIEYSKNQYKEETIDKMLNSYLNSIKVIHHWLQHN